MDIKVIASGSKGNCYWVSDGNTPLLLECGIPFKKIQVGLDFKLGKIKGCLVTHEHKDHSKSILDIAKAGIDVYTSQGTKEALDISNNHRIHTQLPLERFKIGSWYILPFKTEHDAQEPFGFLLYSTETKEKLLFATDTYFVQYKFKGLTHIMIECNYDITLLDTNIASGLINRSRRNRLLKSHFEIGNVIKFLQANDLTKVEKIILLHLSSENSDADRFKKIVQSATGLPTYTAGKNGGCN